MILHLSVEDCVFLWMLKIRVDPTDTVMDSPTTLMCTDPIIPPGTPTPDNYCRHGMRTSHCEGCHYERLAYEFNKPGYPDAPANRWKQ
jgi:hypothetical protein